MPVAVSYPGVYVEEIPSGVRTITGVATSIAAFIGRALRGPTDEPVFINSYADFERTFGGLWIGSTLGYAVRDFYMNGGSQAIIVRLYHPGVAASAASATATAAAGADAKAASDAVKAKADTYTTDPAKTAAQAVATAAAQAAAIAGATPDDVALAAANAAKAAQHAKAVLSADTLKLEASSEGIWGNALRARVDYDVDKTRPDAAALFNLTIRNTETGQTEIFRNLSVQPNHARRVDKVLKDGSSLIRVSENILPSAMPAASQNIAGKDVWGDNNPVTNAKVADADKATDGAALEENDFTGPNKEAAKEGLYALEKADLFNMLCIPPHTFDGDIESTLVSKAASYCELRRRAILIVDPPQKWNGTAAAKAGVATDVGDVSKNAAIFFPRLRQPDPLRSNVVGDFVPCGAIAGVFARTDATRGVWKAPAGLDATLVGVPELSVKLTDGENGELNPLGINCLRSMPAAGRIVWGARTRVGDDRLASEWKYIPVRRTALFIEESLYRGTQWVVFEPNDDPLWAQIRLNVGAFMHNLFRQGAFQGTSPKDAYFVKCDKDTTTQNDINLGIVHIVVGFAPLKPAEFVIIQLQQMAGQIQS